MKYRIITGIMLTLLLISTLSMTFHVVPVAATDGSIKVGVIGPMDWIQGIGMREGAILAAEEINAAGGVLGRNLTIHIGDEGDVPERGTAEMERLCSVEDVHFVVGGFRTEIVYPMREKAMDYRIPFIITGCDTPWLIDCRTTASGPHAYPCGECIREDYERYKYLFRVMPTNTDVLFGNFLGPYLRTHFIPNVLQPALVDAGILDPDGGDPAYPGYPEKVNVSVIIEALDWTAQLRAVMDIVGPIFFGPAHSTIVSQVGGHYYYSVSPLTKNFTSILQDMKARGTHLIFEVFSGEEGLHFIKQWRDMNVSAVPVGINVLSQESEMWNWTDGKCEYEAILGWMGTRTPITPLSIPFWDAYVERWGHAPIYTAFGAYEAIYTIAEACEQAASDHPELTDPATWEAKYNDRTLYDILIPYMEEMDRLGILGRFKFTSTHDIFSGGWDAVDNGVEEYVKPLILQWRRPGRLAVVSAGNGSHTAPAWAPYVEEFQIPPWMLEGPPPPPIPSDVNGDGIVDIHDVVIAALAFGSRPEDPNWNPQADLNNDGLVDIFDMVIIGINYGKTV